MSVDGGEPARLTYHPAPDQALGWTVDGKVLFRSRAIIRTATSASSRWTRRAASRRCSRSSPPRGSAPSPAAARRVPEDRPRVPHWKRYKGGEAEQILVGTLDPLSFTEVTSYDGKDAFPMWASDGRIYFVTDRWGRPNLASMNPDGGDVKRLTEFADYDVRWPAHGRRKDRLPAQDGHLALRSRQRAQRAGRDPASERPASDARAFVDPTENLADVVALERRRAHRDRDARRRVRHPHEEEGAHSPHHREQPRAHRSLPRSRPTASGSPHGPRWTARSSFSCTPPTTARRREQLGETEPGLAFRAGVVARRQASRMG